MTMSEDRFVEMHGAPEEPVIVKRPEEPPIAKRPEDPGLQWRKMNYDEQGRPVNPFTRVSPGTLRDPVSANISTDDYSRPEPELLPIGSPVQFGTGWHEIPAAVRVELEELGLTAATIDPKVEVNVTSEKVSQQYKTIVEKYLLLAAHNFLRKSLGYGPTYEEWGAKGQIIEMWRKYGKIRRIVWDGEPVVGESVKEMLCDLIGNCLLMLDCLERDL